jgi:hypothetical protein
MNIYTEAVRVQDACNSAGIINSLARMLPEIRADVERRDGQFSTDAMNKHPVIIAFIDKLASLAGIQSYESRVFEAHGICDERAED